MSSVGVAGHMPPTLTRHLGRGGLGCQARKLQPPEAGVRTLAVQRERRGGQEKRPPCSGMGGRGGRGGGGGEGGQGLHHKGGCDRRGGPEDAVSPAGMGRGRRGVGTWQSLCGSLCFSLGHPPAPPRPAGGRGGGSGGVPTGEPDGLAEIIARVALGLETEPCGVDVLGIIVQPSQEIWRWISHPLSPPHPSVGTVVG
jgi:hypothetical protein